MMYRGGDEAYTSELGVDELNGVKDKLEEIVQLDIVIPGIGVRDVNNERTTRSREV